MADYKIGDIVVLSAGSMRMAVEALDDDGVHTVWCHEGTIGRDTFPATLLRKWEHREDDRGSRSPRDDKPRGKPGWDGKPREKKYFRKD
ncbi:MAG: hypothetical protein AAF848_08110 [Pseudomonadota bacterium]